MSSPSYPTRRSVLRGAGVLLVAGSTSACLPFQDSDTGPTDAPTDPDRQRVEAVTAQIKELQAFLTAAVTLHPHLGTRLAALRDCHTAHLEVLSGEATSGSTAPEPTPSTPDTTSSASPVVPSTSRAAMTRLRTTERAHVSALAAAASVAQSGALARLLAVMAAGVDQHLAALSEGPEQ